MRFKSINSKNVNSEKPEVIEMIQQGNKVFILVHKLGCPPCMATRPEWLNIQKKMSHKHANNNKVAVVDIESTLTNGLDQYIGDVDGYPTMKLIKDNGKVNIPYENSNISKKDRGVDSFVEWIESSMGQDGKMSDSKSRSNSSFNLKNISPESSPSELLERLQSSNIRAYSNSNKRRRKRSKKNKSKTKSKSKNKNKTKGGYKTKRRR
jgi:hypothetical protein